MKTDREKSIDLFLKNYKTQKDWNENKDNYINKIKKKYNEYLEDYYIIKNKKDYDNMKLGGYIRYVDSNETLKWGGILIKKFTNNNIEYMLLANSKMKSIQVSFYRNTIFYKNHTTASDKTRKLFISYLDNT